MRFSAPVGQLFTLAHYQWSSLSFLPIRGFYQMKVILHHTGKIRWHAMSECNMLLQIATNVWVVQMCGWCICVGGAWAGGN